MKGSTCIERSQHAASPACGPRNHQSLITCTVVYTYTTLAAYTSAFPFHVRLALRYTTKLHLLLAERRLKDRDTTTYCLLLKNRRRLPTKIFIRAYDFRRRKPFDRLFVFPAKGAIILFSNRARRSRRPHTSATSL